MDITVWAFHACAWQSEIALDKHHGALVDKCLFNYPNHNLQLQLHPNTSALMQGKTYGGCK